MKIFVKPRAVAGRPRIRSRRGQRVMRATSWEERRSIPDLPFLRAHFEASREAGTQPRARVRIRVMEFQLGYGFPGILARTLSLRRRMPRIQRS